MNNKISKITLLISLYLIVAIPASLLCFKISQYKDECVSSHNQTEWLMYTDGFLGLNQHTYWESNPRLNDRYMTPASHVMLDKNGRQIRINQVCDKYVLVRTVKA